MKTSVVPCVDRFTAAIALTLEELSDLRYGST